MKPIDFSSMFAEIHKKMGIEEVTTTYTPEIHKSAALNWKEVSGSIEHDRSLQVEAFV